MQQKLKIPIGMFNKGTVIYIDFIYDDDKNKSKKRPAIVIDYNQNITQVIMLKVTTKGVRTQYDYTLANPEMANLRQGSVVRCNHIISLDNRLQCEMHGNLSRQDISSVEILYRKAIYDNAIIKS